MLLLFGGHPKTWHAARSLPGRRERFPILRASGFDKYASAEQAVFWNGQPYLLGILFVHSDGTRNWAIARRRYQAAWDIAKRAGLPRRFRLPRESPPLSYE